MLSYEGGHRLTDVPHGPVGQRPGHLCARKPRVREAYRERGVVRSKVGGGDYRHHAGHHHGSRPVDRHHAGVRMRAADEARVEEPVRLQVIEKDSLAGDQAACIGGAHDHGPVRRTGSEEFPRSSAAQALSTAGISARLPTTASG